LERVNQLSDLWLGCKSIKWKLERLLSGLIEKGC